MKKFLARINPSFYKISIGNDILSSLPQRPELSLADKIVVVVSSNLFQIHENFLKKSLGPDLFSKIILMDDGEEKKNYKYAEIFFNTFIKLGLTRKSLVVAIGGGVVGDFVGFLAAFYMRGISIVHVPTTLLAMVDSSLGGKVAVNLKVGKNVVGAFHQPRYILSEVKFLTTLPAKEWKNGLTEILKHGLIGEKNTLDLLKKHNLSSIKELKVIEKLVYYSAVFKISVVEKDEKEGGLRSILNFGHTFGHALESFFKYQISHGEAVALGILVATEISKRMKFLSAPEALTIKKILYKYRLLNKNLKFNSEQIIDHMKYDKKNVANRVNFVLLKKIGNPVYNQQVDKNLLKDILDNLH